MLATILTQLFAHKYLFVSTLKRLGKKLNVMIKQFALS